MSAAVSTNPQIPVTGERDAGMLQQIANAAPCQEFQLTFTLEMKTSRRPLQIFIDVAGMAHDLTDSVGQARDNVSKRPRIQKTGLRNPIKASRRIQCPPAVCRSGKHKGSR